MDGLINSPKTTKPGSVEILSLNIGDAGSRLWVLSQSFSPVNVHTDHLKISLSAESGSAGGGRGWRSRFIANKLPDDTDTPGP